MTTLTVLLVILAALAAFVISIYNKLVKNKNLVEEGWSGIETQLKRRANLIPNLIETVKGYAKHERAALEEVTSLRTRAMSATDVEERGQTEGLLSAALGRLFAVAEAYPDLKANQNFISLQDDVASMARSGLVYALLWLWVIDSSERGLFNQIIMIFGMEPMNLRLSHPMVVIVVANGLIGASLGMIIFTSAIRSIPEHLFHAARADGAGSLAIVRHVILPALRWPISYITIYQALALLVSFEYIFLIMGPARSTMTMAMLSYTKTLAPQIGGGQYAYGAAIAMILIVIGIIVALVMWRMAKLKDLLQEPRIEVR